MKEHLAGTTFRHRPILDPIRSDPLPLDSILDARAEDERRSWELAALAFCALALGLVGVLL